MTVDNFISRSTASDLDLSVLVGELWSRKGLSLGLVTIVTALAIFVSYALPEYYQSKALLAAKSDSSVNGLANLANQYGGLASLAGINLDGMAGGGMSRTEIAQEKIQSLVFFEDELYDEVLVQLMAVGGWERASNVLRIDPKIYDVKSSEWVREVAAPRSPKPSSQEAHKEFLRALSISKNSESGLITITVEHLSPHVAQRWLTMIITRVSETIRQADIDEAKQSIEFLANLRDETKLIALDEVFAQLIEEQTKKIMLASVSRDYVFEVIEPPYAPELRSSPNRLLIVVLGFLLGCFVAIFVVFVRYTWLARRDAS